MRRTLTIVLACVLAIVLSGCMSVPGTVKFVKNQSGQWEAVEITAPSEGITPGDLRELEDFFNDR
ncbi:MAG: hypothetical protein ACYTGW_22695 [Planctomycetota bacterium]